MDYEYDAAANKIRLSWFRYGSTTTYQVKVFENPEERILMLQYVEGMRIPQFSSNGGRAILEDLNLFWKCIADAELIPFYKDRMYADAWSFWEEK